MRGALPLRACSERSCGTVTTRSSRRQVRGGGGQVRRYLYPKCLRRLEVDHKLERSNCSIFGSAGGEAKRPFNAQLAKSNTCSTPPGARPAFSIPSDHSSHGQTRWRSVPEDETPQCASDVAARLRRGVLRSA